MTALRLMPDAALWWLASKAPIYSLRCAAFGEVMRRRQREWEARMAKGWWDE